MLVFDGPRQHDDLACAARRQRKPSLRRAHVGQRPKHRAKPPYFDSQPRAMRFIGALRSECPRDERVPRHVSGPRFAQRSCEREQHRTLCERNHRACVTHDMTARVHDECFRRQQRFDVLEQEESLPATRNQARSGRVQDEVCTFDLRRQRRDACVARCALGPSERSARRLRPRGVESRSPRPPTRGRSSTREGRARGRARRAYARPRRCARSGGGAGPRDNAHARRLPGRRALRASPAPRRAPSQASQGRARRARSRLRDDTPRAGHGLLRTEGTRSTSQQSLRSNEIAELRHRNASKRERRRVVAQGDPLQCAEGITRRQCTGRGDQRVHRNPATLVTLTVRYPAANLSHDHQPARRIEKGTNDEG